MLFEDSMRATRDNDSFGPSSISCIPRHLTGAVGTELSFERMLSSSDMVGRDEFNDGVEEAIDEESETEEAEDK